MLAGIVLIGVPTAVLMFALGDSVHDFIGSVRDNTLQIPAPPPSVAEWPIVGKKVHGVWSQAHTDLPAVVQSLQPKLGDLAKSALALVASIGGAMLLFLASFIIAGIIMAFGRVGRQKHAGRFSIASSAPGAAKNSPSCPRRPFVRWHWASSAWRSSRPSSSAWS